ncbi:GNAT family N-acetyltransferase [Halomonas heilongjiangensis]|uniref:N-acetyltransferase domain-containing protein n=1 Tax=Halomonas heilongjiangensis TaxID=1387883 RepID=A0A2N7TRB4_9GAMM|nr:GNAT family N-acetyltransferase [Halomonas heilongjiangensis]PMR70730.1 hypothetical protein C1H66_05485 [Halomonas heilongjiangensis]PXX93949.1 hypothetical protein CR158_02895 [Halomonas heilongjiangensis]
MMWHFRRLQAACGGVMVVLGNLVAGRKVSRIGCGVREGIVYRGMEAGEYGQVMELYASLHDGRRPNWVMRAVCRWLGGKMTLVAVARHQGQARVVGMNMYYVNRRDIADETIHEGFIGVSPDMTGRGVASELKRVAIHHFETQGFKGISARISLDNKASLASAEKLGFVPVERYHDAAMRADRQYLIRWFQDGS